MDFSRLARRLAKACDSLVEESFAPAEEFDVESLVELSMPESVIEFYREFAPVDTLDVGEVRFWSIPQILEENRDYSPGAEVHDLGYLVIASNRNGDLFCLDLGPEGDAEPPTLVRLPHDVQTGSQDRALVEGQAEAVSESFEDFLIELARGEVV